MGWLKWANLRPPSVRLLPTPLGLSHNTPRRTYLSKSFKWVPGRGVGLSACLLLYGEMQRALLAQKVSKKDAHPGSNSSPIHRRLLSWKSD
jgi:hypothetical protein